MKPTHVIFSLVEGKLHCKVVELPEEPQGGDYGGGHSGSYWKEHDDWEIEVKQALANGVDFKELNDIIEMTAIIYDSIRSNLSSPLIAWQPEYGKPYKIPEGLEIEIFTIPKTTIRATKFSHSEGGKQFAFLSKPKDVFDTGARLPEQKEEAKYELSYCPNCVQMTNHVINVCQKCHTRNTEKAMSKQEESQSNLWEEVYDNVLKETTIWNGIKKSRDEFTLTRKS